MNETKRKKIPNFVLNSTSGGKMCNANFFLTSMKCVERCRYLIQNVSVALQQNIT